MTLVRPFSECIACGETIEVRNRLAHGLVLEDHGKHSCDCPHCLGLCPRSRTPPINPVIYLEVGLRWRGPKAPRVKKIVDPPPGSAVT